MTPGLARSLPSSPPPVSSISRATAPRISPKPSSLPSLSPLLFLCLEKCPLNQIWSSPFIGLQSCIQNLLWSRALRPNYRPVRPNSVSARRLTRGLRRCIGRKAGLLNWSGALEIRNSTSFGRTEVQFGRIPVWPDLWTPLVALRHRIGT